MDTPATAPPTTPEAGATAATPMDDNRLLATAYEFLVQTLSNPNQRALFFPDITDEGKNLLMRAGLDPARSGQVLEILSLAARAQEQNAELEKSGAETQKLWSELKKGLTRNVLDTTNAYSRTMWMYIISFYAGLGMIVAAVVFAWIGKDPVFPIAFGGLGTASTITFFFTKPPEGLQRSRVSLALLQSALLSWYTDFVNQQIMFLNTQNKGAKPLTLHEYEQSADKLVDRTEKWMQMLGRAVEQNVQATDAASGPPKK